MEVKNIVLDIGNVLSHFCWERVFRETLGLEGEDFERVADATVRDRMWAELDRGLLSDEEVIRGCINRSPSDEEVIREFFTHLGDLVEDYEYAKPWILTLKNAGMKVYLLSNFGETSFLSCKEKGNLCFCDLADGALISYEVKKVKPEPEIYALFLERFGLRPEECLFFDDREDNVLAARKAGMHAEVFTGIEAALRDLQRYGISLITFMQP